MKKVMSLAMSMLIGASMITGCTSQATQAPAAKPAEVSVQETKAPTEGKEEAAATFTPRKEVEIVVPSSAGGGSDLNARTIADIAFKNEYSPKNFMITNMPGGSGGVAFSYVYSKDKNDETMMVLHNGQIMSTIVNGAPVTSDMLTYLPVVAFDNLLLVVKKDSPYKTIEEFIEDAKTPDKVKVGGSQRGNTDHLAFELMNKYAETKSNYVQFNSSGDTMTALLGGHVDVGIFNPSECLGQIEAGELIPLATFAAEKIGGQFTEVPTFKEKGYEKIELAEVRAFAGPPNMSAEAIKFYDEVIKKVTEKEEWQKNYIEKNNLQPAYMNSADAKAFFEKDIENYKAVFKEVGVIQ